MDDDGQWSEGLISAARMVAAATHSLCEAANAMVQGHASEEKLVAAAKEVAGSTAALLVACKVKADPGSVAMHRLQELQAQEEILRKEKELEKARLNLAKIRKGRYKEKPEDCDDSSSSF
ncbi:hypothetical protein KUTeg_009228 [Tegillarca granosa]|uniref:I/LWEQ domain-containing protein n=1 Tax=Tegillarca granosa TaxID=220873 RepID=A0ABQ9F769_TEGGR|nr:hypothetical protein KUTeg_009228 [Tegillarca granosa]